MHHKLCLKGIWLNLFHIIIVLTLLLLLATHLKPGWEILAIITYILAGLMVAWHVYKIWRKVDQGTC
jgi:hypothetical protein